MAVRFTNPAFSREALGLRRLKIVYLFFWFGYLVVVARGVDLMLQDNQKLEKMAMKQYKAAIQQATDRSRILDSKGQELAISIPAWSLYADPREIKNFSHTAGLLAKGLGISKEGLLERLREGKKFAWIKRRVDTAAMEKVRQLNLEGVYHIKENMRFYPHGDLAGSVLGAVGVDSKALGGVEMAYDSYLMIQSKTGDYLKDARGQLYVTSNALDNAVEKGDVHLTLDKNLQFFAEEALAKAARQYTPKGAVAIVMDPATGGILAMANYPSFNPNHFDQISFGAWRNRGLTDVYEPGSTFKVITAAAALESGVVSLDEKFNCENGAIELPDGNIINDHNPYGHLNLGEIVKVSSNIGIFKVSQRLGKQRFHETIKAFGFGSKTGIDYPGEVAGIVRPVQKWRPIETGTISFGQGIGVTSLQIASAFAAIANGGVRMRPHLVEKVVGHDGQIFYQTEYEPLGRPISQETAKILTRILEKVVGEGGTAPMAAIDEYPVAGKTGTAQKVDPQHGGYLKEKYIASFVGFAPADHPKLVVLVLLDEPQGPYYGGVVAAPVFKEIMVSSLHYLGVPPEGKEKTIWTAGKNLNPAPAVARAEAMTQEGDQFKVPDFRGVSLRQVLKAAGEFPIEMEFKGRGEAILQSPQPGALVSAGSKIYVEFAPIY